MELPREWVEKADAFLLDAEHHAEHGPYWLACFEAQQAAELYLKALLVSIAGTHPFTHDLAELLETIGELGHQPPSELLVYADALTSEYTVARYPTRKPKTYNAHAARRCVEYAKRIIQWVRSVAEGFSQEGEGRRS